MTNVINFQDYKEKRERAQMKAELINKVKSAKTRKISDQEFYKLVDLFLEKHYPDAFWKFDLFINGKME